MSALGHRPAIRAPRQAPTGSSARRRLRRRRFGGLTGEDAAAARRVARAGRVERAGHVDVIDQRQAVHVLQIVIALVRLQRLVRLGAIALRTNVTPTIVRPGLDVHARLQPLVDRVGRLRHVRVATRRLSSSPPTCAMNTRSPSIADLELVRELQPGHVADDVAEEVDAELVLGILREVVAEEQAAARAERQALDVILLRVVRRNAVGRAARARCRCRRPGC